MPAPATSNGIYRTPGRAAEIVPPPLPPLRLLLLPLGPAAGVALAIALPVVVFNIVAAVVLDGAPDTRFVPAVATAQDVLALVLLASPVWLGLVIAQRVKPYFRVLRPWMKVCYAAVLLAVETSILVTAEASILASRGGPQLFEPTLKSTSFAPDGRRAHVYGGGLLSCRYEVYVAEPFGLTMEKRLTVPGHGCDEPTPHVRWNDDDSVQLVDDDGKVIEPRGSDALLPWGGGC